MDKMTKSTVTINKKVYKLNKGIGFFKEIGILPKKSEENVNRLSSIVFGLKIEDPFAVAELLSAALTEEEDLSTEAIEEFVFNEADVVKEASNLIDFLKQTAFKGMVNKLLEEVEGNLKRAKAEMEKELS